MLNLSCLVSSLKVAVKHNKNFVKIAKTKLNREMLVLLYNHGYIGSFSLSSFSRNSFVVYLSPEGRSLFLSKISVVSSSKRVFMDFKKISSVYKLTDFFIVSTPKGLMLGSELFFYGLGGEVLVHIK